MVILIASRMTFMPQELVLTDSTARVPSPTPNKKKALLILATEMKR